jgi:hypothetical protein
LVIKLLKQKEKYMNIKYANRSPHLDSLQAKEEFEEALPILESKFGAYTKVARSQTFQFENGGNPIHIKIISAPSSLKLIGETKSTIKALFSKIPFYVLFTRDVKSYPPSKKTYYDKVSSLYSIRSPFKGAIMGMSELESHDIVNILKSGDKLLINLNRYKDAGGAFTLEKVLMERYGISAKKAKQDAQAIETLIIR